MSKLTLRRQPNLHDERQLFSPDQLEVDMHIGNVTIFEPTSISLRAGRAAAALAFSYGRGEDQSRTKAAREAWRFRDLEGPVPRWHGFVKWLGDRNVAVELVAGMGDSPDLVELAEGGFDALPAIERPTELITSYEDLGLVAVQAETVYRPGTFDTATDVGRWRPYATLSLED